MGICLSVLGQRTEVLCLIIWLFIYFRKAILDLDTFLKKVSCCKWVRFGEKVVSGELQSQRTKVILIWQWKHQFSSVTQSCLTLCDPMDCSTPGLPVHHQLPELTQTHVHRVSDAIQPSHPLLSPSPPAFNISQHQGLFQGVSSLHQVAKVLEFQLQWWWSSCEVMSDSCDPMDCSLLGSSVHGIFQARILEWIVISFSRGSSWPRNWTQVSCISGRLFTNWAMREVLMEAWPGSKQCGLSTLHIRSQDSF